MTDASKTVTTQAGLALCGCKPRDNRVTLEAKSEAQKRFSLDLERVWLNQDLDFGILASRMVRQLISVF